MRLATIRLPDSGELRYAVVSGDEVIDLDAADARLNLSGLPRRSVVPRNHHDWFTTAGRSRAQMLLERASEARAAAGVWYRRDEVTFGPPIRQPRKFIAAGRNYADHVRESQRIWAARGKEVARAARPTAFAKFASSIVGPHEPIRLPVGVNSVDYEVELAVIIGAPAHDVDVSEALEFVAGYTICNDIGARDIQRFEMEHQIGIVMAKNFPTFAPLGPWLVTSDEIPDPQILRIGLEVNGEPRQDANTADMIFSVAELIAYWSRLGLEPGDIITTGTPAGVALARSEPEVFYLKPGDTVRAFIEGIGALVNPVSRSS